MNKLFNLFSIFFILLSIFSCADPAAEIGDNTNPDDLYELGQAPNDIVKYNNGYVIISSMSSIAQVFTYKESSIFLTLINQGSETTSTLSSDGMWRVDGRTTAKLVREFSLGQGVNPYKATVVGDNLYTTALEDDKLLIHNLTNGNKIDEVDIPKDGQYNSKPSGIVNYGDYILVACSFYFIGNDYSVNYRDKGKVFVYDYVNSQPKGYIDVNGKNTNALYIKNDILYIISSGSYDSNWAYENNGNIESIDLSSADLSIPLSITTTNIISGIEFRVLQIVGTNAYTNDNGKILKYDISGATWTKSGEVDLAPSDAAFSYISALNYSSTKNKLYAIEGNSMKLYTVGLDLGLESNYITGQYPTALLINE